LIRYYELQFTSVSCNNSKHHKVVQLLPECVSRFVDIFVADYFIAEVKAEWHCYESCLEISRTLSFF
jgi:hypothetical protein